MRWETHMHYTSKSEPRNNAGEFLRFIHPLLLLSYERHDLQIRIMQLNIWGGTNQILVSPVNF